MKFLHLDEGEIQFIIPVDKILSMYMDEINEFPDEEEPIYQIVFELVDKSKRHFETKSIKVRNEVYQEILKDLNVKTYKSDKTYLWEK